jgi:signal transduction histidine kinase
VVGVVEIYRVPDALFRAIDEGVRLIWISAGLSAALLYVALFGIALRARQAMARQQERLLEAEALAAVGAVASAVAHGIRNPLASIRSSAELAVVEDRAGTLECLGDIQREADRVEGWVRDLLLQARGEAVAPGAVDAGLLLAESCRSFAAAAARQGIAIEQAPGAGVPAVRAEAGALGQAIDNLIANAIEAMPEGGQLRLATALATDRRMVEIIVEDTGAGMPEDGGRLFFSTKARGTGLGLVLTRRMLERQSGTLRLENRPGGGTTAIIRLPMAMDATP